MGSRDVRHREQKKQKKDTKKVLPVVNTEVQSPQVELYKRPRKERPEED